MVPKYHVARVAITLPYNPFYFCIIYFRNIHFQNAPHDKMSHHQAEAPSVQVQCGGRNQHASK